jgi:hypothetical protein
MLAVALAMGVTLLPAPARGATFAELIGALTRQACERMLLGTAAEATALAMDAVTQYAIAESRHKQALERVKRASEDASNAQWGDILAEVEVAHRELNAYRIAGKTIAFCYKHGAQHLGGDVTDDPVLHARGTWTAVCRYAGDSKVPTHSHGIFRFSLIGRANVVGSYQEEGGPAGAIAGRWREAPTGFFVDGSTSAALGESQGTWRGLLNKFGQGSGDLEVRRTDLDLVCSGAWQTN